MLRTPKALSAQVVFFCMYVLGVGTCADKMGRSGGCNFLFFDFY